MKRHLHFSRFDCAILVVNLLAFGALLVLLTLKGANVELVLLTTGAGLTAAAKLASAYWCGSKAAPTKDKSPA
jgi:hypothetical protein